MNYIPLNKNKINHKTCSKIPKFDVSKLKGENDYTQTLQNIKDKTNWPQLQKAIIHAATETIPLTKTRKHLWWNQECDIAIDQRRNAYGIKIKTIKTSTKIS